MAVKPILFSAAMIRALLAGTKTQTRRVIPAATWNWNGFRERVGASYRLNYAPGDVLWCREAWRVGKGYDDIAGSKFVSPRIHYEADGDRPEWAGRYRHARFMPRWASRLTLVVTEVRVQRLNDISEEDAIAEGCIWDPKKVGFWVPGVEHPNKDFPYLSRPTAREMYAALWDTINGSCAWGGNPWVAAYTFEPPHHQNVEAFLADRNPLQASL